MLGVLGVLLLMLAGESLWKGLEHQSRTSAAVVLWFSGRALLMERPASHGLP